METKRSKYDTIKNWKSRGVIYNDFDELYYTYIRTLNCCACNKEFKNSFDRCLDHNHETGLFRAIVCQNCNKYDSYIKYPDGYDKKKVNKEYREANKEYFGEYKKNVIKQIKKKLIKNILANVVVHILCRL